MGETAWIIRTSGERMLSVFGTREQAEEKAREMVKGTKETYVII